jgi:hypothetical protein
MIRVRERNGQWGYEYLEAYYGQLYFGHAYFAG